MAGDEAFRGCAHGLFSGSGALEAHHHRHAECGHQQHRRRRCKKTKRESRWPAGVDTTRARNWSEAE
jgi:hypothetical protein